MNEFFINKPDNTITPDLTTEILNKSDAIEYHKSLPVYKVTPVVSLPNLARKYGIGNIYVKDESHRFGLNAFKGLGASYAIHKVLEQNPDVGIFCTATDGNHGKAVAWAVRISGKKAVIFVPNDTTEDRIRAISNEGAEVIQTESNYDITCDIAVETSAKNGWQLVQDTALENYIEIPAQIMAGYLTMLKELEDSLNIMPKPKADIVFLQAGVGSFAGSAIWYYLNRYGINRPKIVIVEPSEADGIIASFKANKRVGSECSFNTIMAGLNCGIPSLTAWDIIKSGADISMKVDDIFAEQAIRELYYPQGGDTRIIAGESGAAGLAGLIAIMKTSGFKPLIKELNISPESRILLFNTEGATDLKNFNKIISQ